MEGKKCEVICCGLCPDSFKTRMELYQHFNNRHSISQEFRGYSALTSKTANRATLSSLNQSKIDKDMNDINKILAAVPSSVISSLPNNIMKEAVNGDATSSLEMNISSTNELAESQLRFGCNDDTNISTARNLATAAMLNMRQDQILMNGTRIEQKGTLNFNPTSWILNGGMTRPPHHLPFHPPCNAYPLSNLYVNGLEAAHTASQLNNRNDIPISTSQLNRPQPWEPCAYRNIEMDLSDKENITTNRQVKGFQDERLRVNDLVLYQSPNTCNDISIANNRVTRVNDFALHVVHMGNDAFSIVNNPTESI